MNSKTLNNFKAVSREDQSCERGINWPSGLGGDIVKINC